MPAQCFWPRTLKPLACIFPFADQPARVMVPRMGGIRMVVGTTRRDFLKHGVVHSLGGAVAASLCSTGVGMGFISQSVANEPPSEPRHFDPSFDPRAKLRRLSKNQKQLWTVIYVESQDLESTLERDVEASFEGGADAVVMEYSKDPAVLERAVAHFRKKYPGAVGGANYLGGEGDLYGFKNGFRIAREYALEIVWTDFCGVDQIKELPDVSLHEIESERAKKNAKPGAPDAILPFYCSGIHMKYGTLVDPAKSIERSALQAMGWVDGIIITGPKTGVPADPKRAQAVRRTVGAYPVGVASGVSAQNIATIITQIDFCLVNTSISDSDHRIIAQKVRELRSAMQ